MVSIGEMLRNSREAQGRSVEDLAAELCITQVYVRAIEKQDVQALPGFFFYQSFARQYAEILGLDRAEVDRALAAALAPGAQPAETDHLPFTVTLRLPSTPHHPGPVRALDPIVEDSNRRYFAGYPAGLSVAGLVAAVVLGSGIFAWWTRPPQARRVAAITPAAIASPAPSTPSPATSEPALSAPEPAAGAPEEHTAPNASTAASTPVSTDATLEATASIDDSHQVTLNLSATERTWLSITSQGKVIFSGILEASQSKTLKGSEVATMKIGNAGGVEVQWNGKSIGPIGARGEVRTVRFTREDYRILSPGDESSEELSRDNL